MTASRVRRLLGLYDAAVEADHEGAAWYDRAQREVRALARTYGVTPRQAAGVVAALSPRVRWAQNIEYAELVLQHWSLGLDAVCPPAVPVFRSNRDKGSRILRGERPLDVLGGPKVRAFYRNLTGDLHAVTIDVWAARALDAPPPRSMAEYEGMAVLYRRAADRRETEPARMQSAVWAELRARPYERLGTGAIILEPGRGDWT